MNIVSGLARNLELAVPEGWEVRPTAVRARKALFDSLGSPAGFGVLDLFSGSGALALEAASRGAEWIAMLEIDAAHIRVIEENCRRVLRAGVQCEKRILEFDALNAGRYASRLPGKPDWIFADPPYAKSGEFFQKLLSDPDFTGAFKGAKLIWELPDTPGAMGAFLRHPALPDGIFRKFGGVTFLIGALK